MPTRRYTDEEVAEIFRRATTDVPSRAAGEGGMSLAELQEIGREVGLAPETVAAAARSLEEAAPTPTVRLLGLPIGVADGVVLERRLTDEEWDHLVVAARDTFGARGALRQDGGFRQWTNSNLQMLLEPAGEGHRLRLRTLNGHARRMILSGVVAIAAGAVFATLPIVTGVPVEPNQLESLGILAAVGAALLGRGVWGLRAWAARRQAQFRDLADRAMRMTQPE